MRNGWEEQPSSEMGAAGRFWEQGGLASRLRALCHQVVYHFSYFSPALDDNSSPPCPYSRTSPLTCRSVALCSLPERMTLPPSNSTHPSRLSCSVCFSRTTLLANSKSIFVHLDLIVCHLAGDPPGWPCPRVCLRASHSPHFWALADASDAKARDRRRGGPLPTSSSKEGSEAKDPR